MDAHSVYANYHVDVLSFLMQGAINGCLERLGVLFHEAGVLELHKDVFPVVLGGMAYNSVMHANGAIQQAIETRDVDLKLVLPADSHEWMGVNAMKKPLANVMLDVAGWWSTFNYTGDISTLTADRIRDYIRQSTDAALATVNDQLPKNVARSMDIKAVVRKRLALRLFQRALITTLKKEVDAFFPSKHVGGVALTLEVSDVMARLQQASKYAFCYVQVPELVALTCTYDVSGARYSMECMDTSLIAPASGSTYWYNMYTEYLKGRGGVLHIPKELAVTKSNFPINADQFMGQNRLYTATLTFVLMDTLRMLKKGGDVHRDPRYSSIDYMMMDTRKYVAYIKKGLDLLQYYRQDGHDQEMATLEACASIRRELDRLKPEFERKLSRVAQDPNNQAMRKEYADVIYAMHQVFSKESVMKLPELKALYDAIPDPPNITQAVAAPEPRAHVLPPGMTAVWVDSKNKASVPVMRLASSSANASRGGRKFGGNANANTKVIDGSVEWLSEHDMVCGVTGGNEASDDVHWVPCDGGHLLNLDGAHQSILKAMDEVIAGPEARAMRTANAVNARLLQGKPKNAQVQMKKACVTPPCSVMDGVFNASVAAAAGGKVNKRRSK
jgi:hypothetical protein